MIANTVKNSIDTDYEITIFTQPVCPQCKTTKAFLAKNDVKYKEISIQESDNIFDIIQENNLRSQAPITVMQNKTTGKIEIATSGFNKKDLENMVDHMTNNSLSNEVWDF